MDAERKISPDLSSPQSRRIMLGAAALVMMGMVGVSYREWRRYNRAIRESAQTREIIDSTNELLASLTDAETGQRGFLLTGNERYLETYNQAAQAVPNGLTRLKLLLAARPAESADAPRLNSLVEEKLTELRQTIELRRTQGAQAAVALELSDQGKLVMDQIRALAAEIQHRENSGGSQASREGEAAAGTALLATVAGSIVLLFLLAFGLEPFASPDPQAKRRPMWLRYGGAVLAVVAAALFRAALTPLMGEAAMPYSLFLPAIWFAAWFGGFRPGVVSVALSLLVGDYFFAQPLHSLLVAGRDDQVAMLMIAVVGLGMALLSQSQQRAVERAASAETAERNERQRFETTLASIGDAVIATDNTGRVIFLNPVAEQLTGWTGAEASGRPLKEVFRIVNEETRREVDNPVTKALGDGRIVGLANHTLLISRNGRELAIDDSAAPMRDARGGIMGVVLVFRDITDRRAADKLLAAQAAELRQRAHLMERIPCFVRDLEDRIVYWSPGATDLYAISGDVAVGQVSHTLLKTEFPAPLDQILAHLKTTGQWDGELIYTRGNGTQVTVASHWALHGDEAGRPVAILEVNTDITERKRAEDAQRESELNAQLLRVQDDERRRIGRELHDSAGQNLVMLKLSLDELASKVATGSELRQKLEESIHLANDTISEIRTTSYALYPPMLDELGLKSAIPHYLDGLMERSGIMVSFEIPPDLPRPPRAVELAFFRVLQESLTNALRHSGSKTASVRVDTKDGMIRLEVRDHGKGMPSEILDALDRGIHGKLGVGLTSMKERIRQLGGKLEVSSSDRGTAVIAFAPAEAGSQSAQA